MRTDGTSPIDIVAMRGLGKRFGNVVALSNIDLDIREGEVLTLLGPSGCGKSTLMRIIAGFDAPSEGTLHLRGKDMIPMPPERRPVNMVFQRYALFPHLDVFDNIAFGLRLKNMPEAEVRKRVLDMMDLVQLGNMASRWINEISGGQSQRVALVRALVNEPEVLLLDEPLAALDLKIRQTMLSELRRIQQSTGTTFVYVTHDQDEAMFLSSRVVLMDHGIVVQVGTPDELYFRPESPFAAKFLGETNFIPGKVTERRGHGVAAQFAGGAVFSSRDFPELMAGEDVHILIRPEAIDISVNDTGARGAGTRVNGCVATLILAEKIGGRLIVSCQLADGTIVKAQKARLGSDQSMEVGQPVWLRWPDSVVAMLSGKPTGSGE